MYVLFLILLYRKEKVTTVINNVDFSKKKIRYVGTCHINDTVLQLKEKNPSCTSNIA